MPFQGACGGSIPPGIAKPPKGGFFIMNSLPNVGDVIVVYGLSQKAKVASVTWDATFYDWIIKLDWGDHGTSKVKFHDENKVWYRWNQTN